MNSQQFNHVTRRAANQAAGVLLTTDTVESASSGCYYRWWIDLASSVGKEVRT